MKYVRYLARVENPTLVATELSWINSRVAFLGEQFGVAVRSIQALIDDGSMIVVEPIKPPAEEYPDNGPTDPWQTSGPNS